MKQWYLTAEFNKIDKNFKIGIDYRDCRKYINLPKNNICPHGFIINGKDIWGNLSPASGSRALRCDDYDEETPAIWGKEDNKIEL